MPTQTTTSTVTHNTRNSRNAGITPGIAFGTHIPPCATPRTSKRNSDKTANDDLQGSMNGIPRDDDLVMVMMNPGMVIQMTQMMTQTMKVPTTILTTLTMT
jgi:hypothetical protein